MVVVLNFKKRNGCIVEGIIHNYEMGNDGWYRRETMYEPEEFPDSWIETMIIELEDGYDLHNGDIITVSSEFRDYHPKCGTFNVIGDFELKVIGKRKQCYYLEGVGNK